MWLSLGVLATSSVVWVAAEVTSPDGTSELIQQGPLGVAVLALAAFARAAYNREKDRADRLETALEASRGRELAMAEKMGTEVTSVVLSATQALKDFRDDQPPRRTRREG